MELLEHLPHAAILNTYRKGAGRELEGKADSPASSSALVANAFGYFLDKPRLLPPLPDLDKDGWPADAVALEANVRFPWAGGRHPWLDVLVTTSTHMIGIESKRFEPYRGRHEAKFSQAFDRDIWSPGVKPYLQLMLELRSGGLDLHALDSAQLVKHALALSAQSHKTGKRAVLYYVYADPHSWPDSRPISDIQRSRHAAHLAVFSQRVAGADVRFASTTYSQVLKTWLSSTPSVRAHAQAVGARYGISQGFTE